MSHDHQTLFNPSGSTPEASADEPSLLNPIPGRLILERIDSGHQLEISSQATDIDEST